MYACQSLLRSSECFRAWAQVTGKQMDQGTRGQGKKPSPPDAVPLRTAFRQVRRGRTLPRRRREETAEGAFLCSVHSDTSAAVHQMYGFADRYTITHKRKTPLLI